jgi:hypothetical protein
MSYGTFPYIHVFIRNKSLSLCKNKSWLFIFDGVNFRFHIKLQFFATGGKYIVEVFESFVGKLVRFKQKGQKQASFLAFHKCCQGCLLRGPLYIATGYQECLFVGWKVYSSSTNKPKMYSYSIFVQQMYWLQDNLKYCASRIPKINF